MGPFSLPGPANILSRPAAPAPPAPPALPALPKLRDFSDARALRQAVYDETLNAARNLSPISDGNVTLSLKDVDWKDPDRFTKKQRKEALLTGGSLARRMHGTWELADATGNVLDSRRQVIGAVPYVSSMGTIVHKGTDYTVNHQKRLLPGVFARQRENGELESYVNAIPGKGVSHRYFLDPDKDVFKVRVQQAEIPLLPILHALGATDEEVRNAWGTQTWADNAKHLNSGAAARFAEKILRKQELASPAPLADKLRAAVEATELDPEVMESTLGAPYKNLNKDVILAATKKLLAIHRGEAEPDDRDHLAYQKIVGPEDLFAERIAKDHGNIRRLIFRKLAADKSLAKMPSGLLTQQINQVITGSGLGQAIEEVNPAEILDKQTMLTSMGEGGLPSLDSIPGETRSVQPSHMNYIDPLRTPESLRAGVDLHLARNAKKGGNKLYAPFRNQRTGQNEWKTPQEIRKAVITTPEMFTDPFWSSVKRVPVMRDGNIGYARKEDIDYVVPDFEGAFSHLGNLVPLKSGVKGQRVAMASRMLSQALPLANPEAPLVQAGFKGEGGNIRSYADEYGRQFGAVAADKGGRVLGVSGDGIKVQWDDGSHDEIDLHNMLPLNRKTFFHQTPLVQPGQTFAKGDILAHSNFTTPQGTAALGLNPRTAFMSWEGQNFEDAITISDSLAKKLTSEHAYQHALEVSAEHKTGKNAFINLFPGKFDKQALARLDEKGIIRPGETVEPGQPLILAAKEKSRAQNKIHKRRQPGYADESVIWDHHDRGVVTDVAWGKSGPLVVVKSSQPMRVGDKLSDLYGSKGVVSSVVPDDQMPVGPDGQPFELLSNPLGTISRTNVARHAEAQLGKLAAHLGHPIKVEDFGSREDTIKWVAEQLKAHGLSDTEDVHIPKYGTTVNVQTGRPYYIKLHHMAEGKAGARGGGGYSAEETPAKGGPGGSKRVGMLATNALLSHGAIETLRDIRNVRGQKQDQWWLQFMQGHSPTAANIPFTYQKTLDSLRAAGINVVKDGNRLHLKALTDKDVDEMAEGRELTSGETVNFDDRLKPIKGGLFDEQLTGSHGGKKWSAIKLPEPLPNPVFEEPIRRVLGLTQKQFGEVLSGNREITGHGTGATAIHKALSGMNLDHEIARAEYEWRNNRGQTREDAVRRWGYLKDAKRLDLHPKDWMLSRAPVLPPAFRPVNMMGNGVPLVSDPNYLYKHLIDSAKLYSNLKTAIGEKEAGPERAAVYHALKATVGLGAPTHPKLVEKKVEGLLKHVFGSSPKFGAYQRRLLSTTVDNVGRGVVIPNPDMDIDSIGIPENQAFQVYSKFVVRELRRKGMPIREALRHVVDRTDLARKTMVEEMDRRPIYMDRAPVLHKFGIMAFKPKLVKGDVIQVSPFTTKGLGMDFDGDTANFHVPSTKEAVDEAYERMLPSKSLLSPADFKTPMFMPTQEYLGGLYTATKAPRDEDKKRRPRVFRNTKDALAAFARGEIDVRHPVEIIEHDK